MKWLQRLWHLLREPFRFLKPIRFIAIPLALLLWGLIWTAQGQDAVRAVIEVDPRCPHWPEIFLFCVVVGITALQVWYWSRHLLRVQFPQQHDETEGGEVAPPTDRQLAARHLLTARWVPPLLGISVFLIALGAIGRAASNSYSGEWDYTMRVATVTSTILVAMLVAFVVMLWVRHGALATPPGPVASFRDLGPLTRRILIGSALLELVFVLWTALSPISAGVVFPSPSLLMVSACLWAAIGSSAVFLFDRYGVPLVSTFLLLAVVFSYFNDNHAVRTLAAGEAGGDPRARQSFDQTFGAWYTKLAAKYPDEPTHPVFVVAAEGGGIRAAYWTAAVLAAIQDQAPQFSDHLFAISGVSGGSVGATAFTALIADHNRGYAVDACAATDESATGKTVRFAAQQMLSYDFLAPTLGSLLHADLVQRFLPVGFIPDRAKALETGWEKGYRSHVRTTSGADDDFFATGFLKMYADRSDALLPSLFLNGTSVEAGNRMIASNCDLRDGAIPDAVDLFDLLGRDMRLSTAAHNSARFSYVSPVGSLHASDGDLSSHVADGGYFENSGAQTADDVIDRLTQIRGNRPFTLHLVLIKFQKVETRACSTIPARPLPPERFVNEALSPIRALMDTRGARGKLAYAEAFERPDVKKYQFLLTELDDGIEMPLGWLLAPRTRAAIDLQVGPATPSEVDCALEPYVSANVGQLRAIARLVSGQEVPLRLDPVQQDAMQAELEAKED